MRIPRFLALLAGMAAAQAGAATIDFESLSRGTVITSQLQPQGVLVSGIDTTLCCQPGKVIDVSQVDLGVFPFGGSGIQALVYGIPGDELKFSFVLANTSTPTTWDTVSLRVGDGDASLESFRVTFRGLGGTVLSAQEFTTSSGSVAGGATVSFFSPLGIQSVEVLGIGSFSGGGVDDLTFTNAVPEPATLGLMLCGLLLVARRVHRV
jgi:hypothetical protein